jgi:hypothetical protein
MNKWQIGLPGSNGTIGEYGKYENKFDTKNIKNHDEYNDIYKDKYNEKYDDIYENKYENKNDNYTPYTHKEISLYKESKNEKNHENHSKNDQYNNYQSPEHQFKPKMNVISPETITSQNNVNVHKDMDENKRDIYLRGIHNLGLGKSFIYHVCMYLYIYMYTNICVYIHKYM